MTALVLECAAGVAGGIAYSLGGLFFCLLVLPDLLDLARLCARTGRAVFLGIGFAGAAVRLLL